MRRLKVLGLLVAAMVGPSTASAESSVIVIANDPGGGVFGYVRGWQNVAANGSRVEIDGYCLSACTLVLGLVPANRVCVQPNASFGFHSVSVNYGEHTPDGTRYLWSLYPSHVQDFLRNEGWDGGAGTPTDGILFVPGTAFLPLCRAVVVQEAR